MAVADLLCPYDEVFSNGSPRPHYAKAYRKYARLSSAAISERAARASQAFDRDAPVLPFPRILTRAEYRLLATGVAQRGRALQAFLRDHYVGERKYLRAKLFPPITIRRILKRNFEEKPPFPLRADHLQFWYAPDIIRDPAGRFRVLEDNVGFVGGLGDLSAGLAAARELAVPRELLRHQEKPGSFFEKIARMYQAQVASSPLGPNGPKGCIVMLSYDQRLCSTFEDRRLEKMVSAASVQTIRTRYPGKVRPGRRTFQNVNGTLVLRKRRGGSAAGDEPVAFVVLNIDHADIEPTHPGAASRFKANWVRGLDRRGIPGFWKAVSTGRVGVSVIPGLEFVSDKEFYASVDQLIRFYLGEEPQLPGLETRSLASIAERRRVFAEIDEWVVKAAVGQCGEAVWIGARTDARQRRALEARVSKEPGRFVAQRYTPLSTVLGNHVDLRMHAVVGPKKIIVSPRPWGRAAPASGDGKVNVSHKGSLCVVLVEAAVSV